MFYLIMLLTYRLTGLWIRQSLGHHRLDPEDRDLRQHTDVSSTVVPTPELTSETTPTS